jgi:RimJ/RimL family protein N-acetyltransferase
VRHKYANIIKAVGHGMITGGRILLRDKVMEDARADYAWETDPELARLDATSPTRASFSRYRQEYAEELRTPYYSSRRFAICTLDGKHIGNCAYYNISEKDGETELGIMIGDRTFWNKGYGKDVICALLDHIFENVQMQRVYLKTLASNYRAQKCFAKSGFKPYVRLVKNGHDFLFMEVYRNDWLEAKEQQRVKETETA